MIPTALRAASRAWDACSGECSLQDCRGSPPACDAAKGEWLAQFHKNVTRKLKEGCVEEDADTTVPKVSSSNEGAEALLRLDTLTARVMVASETVRVLRTEVRHRGRTHKYIHVYVNDSRQVLPSHFTHPPTTTTLI
mgnify:CR=1 FL=1